MMEGSLAAYNSFWSFHGLSPHISKEFQLLYMHAYVLTSSCEIRCISANKMVGFQKLTEHITGSKTLAVGPINDVKCPPTRVAYCVSGRANNLTVDE